MLCITCMVGCGKGSGSDKIEVKDGKIIANGQEVLISYTNGNTAKYIDEAIDPETKKKFDVTFEWERNNGWENSAIGNSNITTKELDKFRGDSYMAQWGQDVAFAIFVKKSGKNNWVQGYMNANLENAYSREQALNILYTGAKNLNLDGFKSIIFQDKVVCKVSPDAEWEVTPLKVGIADVLHITKDTVDGASETVKVSGKELTVSRNQDGWDNYQYEDIKLSVVSGTDLSTLVKFK